MTPCSLVGMYQHFGRICCLCVQCEDCCVVQKETASPTEIFVLIYEITQYHTSETHDLD
jgi:hypothetical protein